MRLLTFLIVGAVIILNTSCDRRSNEDKEIYGVVNARFVTGEGIRLAYNLTKEELKKLTSQEKESLFFKISEQYIVEHESKKIKLSTEALLGFFDKINPTTVAASDLRKYIAKHPLERRTNKEVLIKKIRNERLRLAKEKYYGELRRRSTVKSFIVKTESGL